MRPQARDENACGTATLGYVLVPRGTLPPQLRFRFGLLLHPGALGAGFVASVAMQPALMHGWLVVLGRVIVERETDRHS
jgi:hypothetical protein